MEVFHLDLHTTFRDREYFVEIEVKENELLNIDIEDQETGQRWAGAFKAEYLEEITKKTGNFKKFDLFVKMVKMAFKKSSETVMIDLLTYEDLEQMRRRNTSTDNPAKVTNPQLLTKRYLILSYVVEFDKVHYPLPLNYVESPDRSTLKRTVERLRTELTTLTSRAGTEPSIARGDSIKQENRKLRAEIERLEREHGRSQPKKGSAVETDMVIREHTEAEKDFDQLKKESVKDIKVLTRNLKEVTNQLDTTSSEIKNMQEFMKSVPENPHEIRTLKRKLVQLQDDLKYVRTNNDRKDQKQLKEIARYEEELEKWKVKDRQSNTKISNLENKLDNALKKKAKIEDSPASKSRSSAGFRERSPSGTRRPLSRDSPSSRRSFENSPVGKRRPQSAKDSPYSRNSRLNTSGELSDSGSRRKIRPSSSRERTPTRKWSSGSGNNGNRYNSPLNKSNSSSRAGSARNSLEKSNSWSSKRASRNLYSPKSSIGSRNGADSPVASSSTRRRLGSAARERSPGSSRNTTFSGLNRQSPGSSRNTTFSGLSRQSPKRNSKEVRPGTAKNRKLNTSTERDRRPLSARRREEGKVTPRDSRKPTNSRTNTNKAEERASKTKTSTMTKTVPDDDDDDMKEVGSRLNHLQKLLEFAKK
mmetsp:Transcript_9418/g.10319  ORF Transcript_9418/g.10319 Transcript_9418/m.10319 type:complete len:644 (-) Transcript_9418:265-2196(-)